MDSKVYLGDGVYLAPDPAWPAQLVLTTENGIAADNTIYLDPHVQLALLRVLMAEHRMTGPTR
jgi:hypothetical protein